MLKYVYMFKSWLMSCMEYDVVQGQTSFLFLYLLKICLLLLHGTLCSFAVSSLYLWKWIQCKLMDRVIFLFKMWYIFYEFKWVGVGGFSKVVASFNHVGGSFNLYMAVTRGVWIIPSFRIWDYVLHVEHISCVITNCGQHQWAIHSLFSVAL